MIRVLNFQLLVCLFVLLWYGLLLQVNVILGLFYCLLFVLMSFNLSA